MMSVMEDNLQEVEERVVDDNTIKDDNENEIGNSITMATMSRKEKRKALKKMKRKQVRKEIAKKEREDEEARMNDPEEQMRLLRLEQEEAERMAKERKEFEERERQFLRALELQKKKQEEEDEEGRKLEEEESQKELAKNENASEANEDDDWEYIEEGPAEIIWKGNEIIVKKKKIRVPKKAPDALKENQESERPISNPLAPQSEAFENYRSAKEVLESVAQQVPNFGTEQDKAHCPFHLKTGVCRFGARCSRVHFYPDKACTILIKNMYNGPGLSWEQDEGLEHTEEEVKQSFEDFYEDVHTEFLKFGELVNFKVCKNGSSHLRGNVYVHYKSLESAMLAYQSTNGRYFAGKQLTCEFINVTRWRVAICGEYMKSKFKSCSRGSACNFIHCFQNPGGDYEWADWDKPAPRYWLEKMASLFGYTGDDIPDEVGLRHHSRRSRSRGLDSPHRKNFSDEDDGYNRRRGRDIPHRGDGRETSILDRELQEERKTYQDYRRFKHSETDNVDGSDGSTDDHRNVVGINASAKRRERERMSTDQDNKSRKVEAIKRYHSRRSRSRGLDSPLRKSCSDEDDGYKRRRRKHSPHRKDDRVSDNLDWEMQEDRRTYHDSRCFKDSEADNVDVSEGSIDGQRSVAGIKRSSKKRERERLFADQDCRSKRVEVISFKVESAEGGVSDRYVEQRSRSSSRQKRVAQSAHDCRHKKGDKSDVGKSRCGEKNHDEFHRYEDKSLSVKKNEAGSLNYNSHGDSQDSEEDEHYCRSKKKSRMKDEAESSSSDSQCSDDSRLVKGEKRHHKKRRKRSRFKNKTSDVEIRCDGDSLEGYERKQHRHRENKPRELNIFSESADGRGRLDRDDKRPQKTERKMSRLKNRSGFADTESGLEDDRHHRHSKHSRHLINDNESSDGDKLGRYEKGSHKSVRTRSRSRSKKESELADTKRNTKRVDEEDGHKSAEHHVKEPGLSEVDSNAYRGLFEVDAGNSVSNDRYRNSHAYLEANHHSEQENTGYRYCGTHDQNVQSDFMNPDVQGEILCRSRDGDKLHNLSNRDSASENDHKRLDEECILQVDRSNEKGTASGMVATSLVHTSREGIDNDAKVELEKACRLAALKKLEEIRMKKDTQVSHSREPKGLKDCSEENMHGRVLKKADSSKVEICDTSVKRRRI